MNSSNDRIIRKCINNFPIDYESVHFQFILIITIALNVINWPFIIMVVVVAFFFVRSKKKRKQLTISCIFCKEIIPFDAVYIIDYKKSIWIWQLLATKLLYRIHYTVSPKWGSQPKKIKRIEWSSQWYVHANLRNAIPWKRNGKVLCSN